MYPDVCRIMKTDNIYIYIDASVEHLKNWKHITIYGYIQIRNFETGATFPHLQIHIQLVRYAHVFTFPTSYMDCNTCFEVAFV